MLLNTPRYTGQTPTLKNDMAHDACSAKGEKPRLRRIPGAYAQCCYLQTHGTQNGVGKKWRRTQSGPTQAGLARASLLTPFLQEKVKMDKNVWCLRMSLCPRPQREETLNQNNKGPCAENRVVTNSPGRTEASRTSAIAELMSAPLQATLLGHTPTAGSISAKKRRLLGEVSEQFKTEGG